MFLAFTAHFQPGDYFGIQSTMTYSFVHSLQAPQKWQKFIIGPRYFVLPSTVWGPVLMSLVNDFLYSYVHCNWVQWSIGVIIAQYSQSSSQLVTGGFWQSVKTVHWPSVTVCSVLHFTKCSICFTKWCFLFQLLSDWPCIILVTTLGMGLFLLLFLIC